MRARQRCVTSAQIFVRVRFVRHAFSEFCDLSSLLAHLFIYFCVIIFRFSSASTGGRPVWSGVSRSGCLESVNELCVFDFRPLLIYWSVLTNYCDRSLASHCCFFKCVFPIVCHIINISVFLTCHQDKWSIFSIQNCIPLSWASEHPVLDLNAGFSMTSRAIVFRIDRQQRPESTCFAAPSISLLSNLSTICTRRSPWGVCVHGTRRSRVP